MQTYSLRFGREEIDDATATWIAAETVRKAGEMSESMQVYFEEMKHRFSLEFYSHRQIVEYCFNCRPEDFNKIMGAYQIMLGGAWVEEREDYTQAVPDDAIVMGSEFTSLCAHAMPYLTYHELQTEVLSPLLNVLSYLPVDQHCVVQFVGKPYPDDATRNFHMRMSMVYWELGFLVNPYLWFWPGTYSRHLWANKRMKGPMFNVNLRVCLWAKDRSGGDPEIQEEQLEELELSMQTIHCAFRFQDMHALGICARKSTTFGHEALTPFQERALTKPFPLSGDEFATFYHPVYIHKHPQVYQLLSSTASLPPGLSGVPRSAAWSFFASTRHQGEREPFGLKRVDRTAQLHVIGKSGSGKTKLLELLLREDFAHGKGVAFIDCHGDMTDDILRSIPAGRVKDVYLLDFTDRAYPPHLNLMVFARGPFGQLFLTGLLDLLCETSSEEKFADKNKRFLKHVLAIIAENESATFAELLSFLVHEDFRSALLHHTANQGAKEYFTSNAAEVDEILNSADLMKVKIRLSGLLATDLVSDVLQREDNRFDFQQILEEKKILLVRVPKQSLGNENTCLIGSLVLLLLHSAAEHRKEQGMVGQDLFYVYIDEFQNFAAPSFARYLDGAAKRGLSYALSHQTLGQVSDDMRLALKEGIQNFITFQLGGVDADLLGDALSPSFGPYDVMNLDVRQFFIGMTLDGQPTDPFSGETDFVTYPEQNFVQEILESSRQKVSGGDQ